MFTKNLNLYQRQTWRDVKKKLPLYVEKDSTKDTKDFEKKKFKTMIQSYLIFIVHTENRNIEIPNAMLAITSKSM